MFDPKAIIATTDLVVIVESDLGAAEKTGRWYCPFCQTESRHNPALSVKRDFWQCFGCGKAGDVFGWLKEKRGLEFVDACKLLTGDQAVTARPGAAGHVQSTTRAKPTPDDLQDSWKEIIDVCQKTLWSDRGKAARDYLHRERLLTDETLQSKFHRVGFSEGRKIAGVWVDRGIVIPCFTIRPDPDKQLEIDYVAYVKIRRGKAWLYKPEDGSKYRKLPGHGADLSGLYGAEDCKYSSQIVMTEGEFDALLLRQETIWCQDLAVATLGGSQDHFDWSRFGRYLLAAKTIYVAYDNDQAGDRGSDFWSNMTGRAVRVRVPDGHKDITDYARAGGDLVAWVEDFSTVERD